MYQQLRALIPPEDPNSVPAPTLDCSQPAVTPTLGDPTPSVGLFQYLHSCSHMYLFVCLLSVEGRKETVTDTFTYVALADLIFIKLDYIYACAYSIPFLM